MTKFTEPFRLLFTVAIVPKVARTFGHTDATVNEEKKI